MYCSLERTNAISHVPRHEIQAKKLCLRHQFLTVKLQLLTKDFEIPPQNTVKPIHLQLSLIKYFSKQF